MGAVIGDLLPLAVGVAISPIPIVATILMLLSTHAGSTSTGFGVGWVMGIVVVTGLVVLASGTIDSNGADNGSPAASWTKIVLGTALVVLAIAQWRRRTDTEVPGWMKAIDEFTFLRATGLGMLLSGVNPKNLLLCVSAGITIGTAGLDGAGPMGAVIVFTVLAASTVLVPVVGYALARERIQPSLDAVKTWLQANNHQVMALILLIMGSVVIGKGLGGL
ncbi:GAP family protein [Rhodococcus yananensis]|uniref:GAP family protein n=1 Tax=Rhodococcus yananensis TaxID=2879464 RepID=UPI001CF8A0BC|nr:GAP family protein [Rhodococcus yananensis]